jgi:hypothetical protein
LLSQICFLEFNLYRYAAVPKVVAARMIVLRDGTW